MVSKSFFDLISLFTVRDVALDILKKEMSSLPIPDISGSADISVGKVKYTISK